MVVVNRYIFVNDFLPFLELLYVAVSKAYHMLYKIEFKLLLIKV